MKTLPEDYKAKLNFFQTEKGIKLVKDTFEKRLAEKLSLIRVSAPRFLTVGTGLQDDLAGTQVPVGFKTKFTDKRVEIVHSLAKWKRHALGKYGFKTGTGLYTDMDAIRKDEDVSPIHSIYVDQWDWERIVSKEERSLEFLKEIVQKIYQAILETEEVVGEKFSELESQLPKTITFVHSEELEKAYPHLPSKEREDEITKKHRAVFLIGIGHPLSSGKPHDLRAADYDDWITETSAETKGLNGDILVWDKVREKCLEISSMGIRVDKESLLKQLDMMDLDERKSLEFHKKILEEELPLSVGGGIGQSRLCMLLLQKAHIGEVQSSIWPEEVVEEFDKKRIALL
ncbi:MAG: aspartate--ammonia ligase [Nanoarchaeota archaeon]|nr:aspartate--ammonia ligase [Nanoarchaeota archaeon]MBU1632455.1 aspartate--ammonia ligase [Nanoarchaeota archaeon]MBU1876472.1 aspartate--ammonia ligase [Nanoarchaeota archaeon]